MGFVIFFLFAFWKKLLRSFPNCPPAYPSEIMWLCLVKIPATC